MPESTINLKNLGYASGGQLLRVKYASLPKLSTKMLQKPSKLTVVSNATVLKSISSRLASPQTAEVIEALIRITHFDNDSVSVKLAAVSPWLDPWPQTIS